MEKSMDSVQVIAFTQRIYHEQEPAGLKINLIILYPCRIIGIVGNN